jgi:hypothetical protein
MFNKFWQHFYSENENTLPFRFQVYKKTLSVHADSGQYMQSTNSACRILVVNAHLWYCKQSRGKAYRALASLTKP